MRERVTGLLGSIKWFQWVALVGFGALVGLLIIVVINTRPHTNGQTEEKKVAAEVARHVLLPTDETPALATVTDPSKLKNNPFLKQTRSGDKILIFAKWQQAVIYRPSSDRIVDIGPVDVSAPEGSTNGYSQIK